MVVYSGHPILSLFRNLFYVVSVFSFFFGLYALAELFLLKPENMDVETMTKVAIILGIAFVVCCPLTIILSKKGKSLEANNPPEKQFKDLREENK